MATSITIKGLPSLGNKLRLLVPSTRAAVREAVATTALLIESDAKRFSPVDTGLNRSQIHANIAPNGLSATVTANTSYSVFLEFGTRFQKAQPFLGPAFEKNRGAFIASLKRAGLSVK
jgi:HK97 gp10 family phage protein